MSLERTFSTPRTFGDARLLGNFDYNFFKQNITDQARAQGWSEACPVVERLIKPVEQGGRGAREMRNRYGEINFWFGYLLQTLKEAELLSFATQLAEPHSRRKSEPVGTHDEASVPEEIEDYTFRSPEAYAIPRMLTQYAGLVPQDKQTRLLDALAFFDDAAEKSWNATDLAVLFAEKVVIAVADSGQRDEAALLLRHLVSFGKLKEDSSVTGYIKVLYMMKSRAPRLWDFYEGLSADEKKKARIIAPEDLLVDPV